MVGQAVGPFAEFGIIHCSKFSVKVRNVENGGMGFRRLYLRFPDFNFQYAVLNIEYAVLNIEYAVLNIEFARLNIHFAGLNIGSAVLNI